jgi:hypothetical protein
MSYNKERNTASTPQAIQNGMNIILRNTPAGLMTFDEDEFNRKNKERRAAVDAAEAKLHPPELQENWRQELSELDRRLTGQMDVSEAKTYADAQEQLHKDAVAVVGKELTYIHELLKTPGLSQCKALREGREAVGRLTGQPIECRGCEVHAFRRKVEVLQIKLQQAKAKQQQSIKSCGNIVLAAKELEPFRKRWSELKKREKTITTALRNIREKTVLQTTAQSGSSWIQPGLPEVYE